MNICELLSGHTQSPEVFTTRQISGWLLRGSQSMTCARAWCRTAPPAVCVPGVQKLFPPEFSVWSLKAKLAIYCETRVIFKVTHHLKEDTGKHRDWTVHTLWSWPTEDRDCVLHTRASSLQKDWKVPHQPGPLLTSQPVPFLSPGSCMQNSGHSLVRPAMSRSSGLASALTSWNDPLSCPPSKRLLIPLSLAPPSPFLQGKLPDCPSTSPSLQQRWYSIKNAGLGVRWNFLPPGLSCILHCCCSLKRAWAECPSSTGGRSGIDSGETRKISSVVFPLGACWLVVVCVSLLLESKIMPFQILEH